METVIIRIDDLHTSIGGRNLRCFQQMPLGTAKVVGLPIEKDAVGSIVEMILAATDALIARLQQVFMLIDHAETEYTVHCDDELGECHTFNRLPLH